MGRKVAFWERNPFGQQTIVMLHGFRGNHKGLTNVSQHFEGFRLLLPDLPGYGKSEALEIPHTVEHYSRWLDEFVDALGLEEWVSWSHSYAGSIALMQAAEGFHKPRVVVSVSPAEIRRGPASIPSTFYYWIGQYMPAPVRHRWITNRYTDHAAGRWLFMTVPTAKRLEIQRKAERYLPKLNAQVVIEQYMSLRKVNLEHLAMKVTAPALILAGARDIIVPMRRLERLAGLLPHGTLSVMPDQGHLAPIERPSATASISKRFIHSQGQNLQALGKTGERVDFDLS
jgi:pimeloyl-ACP methyl ester carboxylesterase